MDFGEILKGRGVVQETIVNVIVYFKRNFIFSKDFTLLLYARSLVEDHYFMKL